MGIYTWLFETFTSDGNPPGFFMKAGLGMAAGGCGAFVGTPAEVRKYFESLRTIFENILLSGGAYQAEWHTGLGDQRLSFFNSVRASHA